MSSPASPLRLSADGLFYWDGKQWVSALSPDGRYRWDGTGWVPVQMHPAYAPQYAPQYAPVYQPPAPRRPRVPTPLTRPLQVVVAAWSVVSIVVPVVSVVVGLGDVENYSRQIALRQAARQPDLYPDPQGYASTMVGVVDVIVFIAIAVIVVIGVVVLVGSVRRWTWMYYAALALFGLSTLGLPSAFLHAIGAVPGPVLGSVLQAEQWVSIGFDVVGTAIGAWLLVVLLRTGPWATRRPPSGAQ